MRIFDIPHCKLLLFHYNMIDFFVLVLSSTRVVVQGLGPGPRYGHVMDLVAQRYLVTVSGNDGMYISFFQLYPIYHVVYFYFRRDQNAFSSENSV